MLIDLRTPFRGADAVAAGLVTPKALRGPRFRRLYTGIFVAADVGVDLALLAHGAHLVVQDIGGVVGGWAAAELLGASCAREGAPVEVVLPTRSRPSRPGLIVRRDALWDDEISEARGIPVTTPLRTAFDLARRPPLREAVVAVDALANVHGFEPVEVMALRNRHLGCRGNAQVPEVLRLANRLAQSPMETRLRFAIHDAGLPKPVLQHPVGPYELDMAYPGIRLGVEHDGRDHLEPGRALRDLRREGYLGRLGWVVLRFSAFDVVSRPRSVVAAVRGRFVAAARARGVRLEELELY